MSLTNLAGLFDWFNQVGDIVIYGMIAIIVVICSIMLIKNKESRKVFGYICAFVILCTGVFSAFGLYDEINSKSSINGSLDIHNQFVKNSYYYNVSSLELYADNTEADLYKTIIESEKIENFDGQTKNYEVVFNDYELINQATINAGSIYIILPYEFYNTEGTINVAFDLYLLIKFLSNKTTLEVWCYGNTECQYIEQYFADYGFRLYVNEI